MGALCCSPFNITEKSTDIQGVHYSLNSIEIKRLSNSEPFLLVNDTNKNFIMFSSKDNI